MYFPADYALFLVNRPKVIKDINQSGRIILARGDTVEVPLRRGPSKCGAVHLSSCLTSILDLEIQRNSGRQFFRDGGTRSKFRRDQVFSFEPATTPEHIKSDNYGTRPNNDKDPPGQKSMKENRRIQKWQLWAHPYLAIFCFRRIQEGFKRGISVEAPKPNLGFFSGRVGSDSGGLPGCNSNIWSVTPSFGL